MSEHLTTDTQGDRTNEDNRYSLIPHEDDRGEQASLRARFVVRPLSARVQEHHRRPASDEIHLWRFQSHWIPVQSALSHAWLAGPEWEAAKRFASPAARRRYLTLRVAIRWLFAGVTERAPNDPALARLTTGFLPDPSHPSEPFSAVSQALLDQGAMRDEASDMAAPEPALFLDTAQTFAWTVIGMSGAPFALHTARANAATEKTTVRSQAEEQGYVQDMPMPTPASLALSAQQAPTIVRAFGWRAGDTLF